MPILSPALQRVSIVAMALLAFGACLAGSFHFDDYSLFSDPAITATGGWWQVWLPLETRPLTKFTFWLNYQLFGRNAAGYHAVNLGLHLIAAVLVLDVLSRFIPLRPAWFAAAIFAVHPIQSEPVNYIFARGTLLCTVLCLASLRSWILERHFTALVWFALALLAKEECVAFPLVLLLLWFRAGRQQDCLPHHRRELKFIGAMLALALAAGLRVAYATLVVKGAGAGFGSGIAPIHYLLTQGTVILRYLRLIFIPWGFTVDADVRVTTGWPAYLAWLFLFALTILAARRFSQVRPGFWWIAGLILLLPSSSIFPAADLAADRRMYLPLVAFSACIGLLIEKVNLPIFAILALALAGLSCNRTLVWRTEESLWTEAVERSPNKVRPRVQLARSVEPARALPILEDAKIMAPNDPRIASEIGKVFMVMGKPDRALSEFGRALALAPNQPETINNRGAALVALGQTTAARADFERALQLESCLFDARLNLLRLGVSGVPAANCRYTPEQQAMLETSR